MPRTVSALAFLAVLAGAPAADFDPARLAPIDAAVAAAIKRNECPGAVVLIVHDDKVVFRKGYGLKAKEPAEAPMTADTIFDMASVTKPVATATSIWILLEQGKLRLDDKVA